METIRNLYRIGYGPSSSHTMGPRNAAEKFKQKNEHASKFMVTLYGSLAATGKGHLTDTAIKEVFEPRNLEITWKPDEVLPLHPNGMEFKALDSNGDIIDSWRVYSMGGGAIRDENGVEDSPHIYPLTTMKEILDYADESGKTLWEYVMETEGETIKDFLGEVWGAMLSAINNGLEREGVLPGSLHLQRKASSYYIKSRNFGGELKNVGAVYAYALAVSEENASGGQVVTAPTCGSCGVLPAILLCLQDIYHLSDTKIIQALATAGLIGNLIKFNGSISGAEVGCGGEVGAACAMAAGAAAQLLGGFPSQVEYAAEMGLEHHLGLTCDPVGGLVQIPCIERNAMAAARAIECAIYATFSDGKHRVSFDNVVETMTRTGRDLSASYRETSTAGLARTMEKKK